ncbi:MAG: Uncharacterized protein FD135_4808 [Comamonadaceae bacterium]|nr:MAG: Uncharacterized protein FD135_4808 [Comamonadaceae bacterium]
MVTKSDIATKVLPPWDQYKDKKPDEVANAIYVQIGELSNSMTTWYWASIHTKRHTSLAVRGLAFLGLVLGTTLPIFAAIQKADSDKLFLTQWAVAILAISGLLLVADKAFGWSSGWMRYITTATTMENLSRAFQLEWGRFLLSKTTPLDTVDANALYELAVKLEQELTKLQAEETTKWCAEFNTGISLLETMVKTQREETDKKLDAIRTSFTTQQQAAKSEEQSKRPGAIEITITHKATPQKLFITLDKEFPQEFIGTSWSRESVAPGLHLLRIQTATDPLVNMERIIEVAAASIARSEIKLP